MKTIFNKKVKSLVQNFVKIPIFSPIFIKYCQYFWFWLLIWGGSVGHTIDLNSEFLLGTKIAHIWEENESLVISICGLEAPARGSYKKAIKTGHPVEMTIESTIELTIESIIESTIEFTR